MVVKLLHSHSNFKFIDMRDGKDRQGRMPPKKKARLDTSPSETDLTVIRNHGESLTGIAQPREDKDGSSTTQPLVAHAGAAFPNDALHLNQDALMQGVNLGGLTSSLLANSVHGPASLERLLAARGLASRGLMQHLALDPRIQQLPLLSPTPNLQSSLGSDALAFMRLNLLQGQYNPFISESQLRLGLSQGNMNAFLPSQVGMASVGNELVSPLLKSLQTSGRGPMRSSSDTSISTSFSAARKLTARQLPIPEGEADLPHVSQRICVPLSTDEDQNWLSEFLCFVRADLVEIFRASQDDVRSRNSSKKVTHGQVGIRCRYCAHLPQSARTSRSSSYPSSLSRIYQSLTMMLRDHFGACTAIPLPLKQRFISLKGKTSQGATDSKHFWVYSAKKLGLKDSDNGIWVDDKEDSEIVETTYGASRVASSDAKGVEAPKELVLLVQPDDRGLVSEFTYTLMTHAQLVHMEDSERIGNRKSLPVGLPGLGCRHCCQDNRKGLCRLFPARRRTLPSKIHDLFEHVRRCTLCPMESKSKLIILKNLDAAQDDTKALLGEKEFFDRVWQRMGNSSKIEG